MRLIDKDELMEMKKWHKSNLIFKENYTKGSKYEKSFY